MFVHIGRFDFSFRNKKNTIIAIFAKKNMVFSLKNLFKLNYTTKWFLSARNSIESHGFSFLLFVWIIVDFYHKKYFSIHLKVGIKKLMIQMNHN